MKKKNPAGTGTRKIITAVLILFFLMMGFAPASPAADDVDDLKKQLQSLSETMKTLQEKLDKVEKQSAGKETEIKEMDKRLNKAELHTASDKISFGVDLRSEAQSIHYEDVRMAPPSMINSFFTPASQGGFNGATQQQIQQAMAGMKAAGMVPAPNSYNANNDIIYTSRLRLNMKGTINPHLDFTGRLAAYKVWGDSSGVQFNHGSMGEVTFDGNTSSLPHGDTVHVERAYFNYKQDLGSVPINFSLGRRPSTDGAPLEYGNYSLVGGSPLASIINWQFDGASLTFGLEDVTGIPGQAFKLCYGVGFEGDWGNSYSMTSSSDVNDVHMFGFIADLFDNETTSAVLNYAHAWDVTDGFTGLTVMPFIVSVDGNNKYTFSPNNGGYISRMQPSTNIGGWDAASLLLKTNLREKLANIDLFIAPSWSHTSPSQISNNPYYALMGQGLLSSNGDLQSRNGYSIYAGALFPMPLDARLGLEYNWGSKYWFNFTGAEDSLIGSKLAARGQVFEGYYIQPIYKDNFFVKLGGQYYDYDYTGSGNPLGEPVSITDATAFDSLNAIIDKAWVAYLSATIRF
ncbi:MAG: DUF3373 family protein [Pseudomonadota bacterium]